MCPYQRTRFFNSFSEDNLLEMQAIIAEEFGVYMDLEVPIKTISFMYSKAKNKIEKRNAK